MHNAPIPTHTRLRFALLTVLAAGAAPGCAAPLAAQQPVDMAELEDEAIAWLRDYIRIDTQNPPGNEIETARFFAKIFDAEGIPYQIAESAPGRGNIWARLKGGDEPALVLLHHMDVVPADKRYWTMDPLGAEVKDSLIYGRGTLDTKSSGILNLAAFLALHRSGVPLKRDVMFVATADEEAGGSYGAGWLVKNHPEIFENVGFLLNEGGGGEVVDGRVQFGVEVTQKVPYWLHLKTTGEPSHGSSPHTSSAVTELVDALARLRAHAFKPRIIPAVDAYLKGVAPGQPEPWHSRFQNMAAYVDQPGVLTALQEYDPALATLTRNTCSITRLMGSDKINVVPPEAGAELDCRLLPDQDPQAWLAEMKSVLGPKVEIQVIMGFTPAVSSADTDLYRILKSVTLENFPGAQFVPRVQGGFTDSHFFRDMGITSYGYEATAIPQKDERGIHGNDERISIENVRRGVAMTVEIVRRFAARGGIM
jgi:acetylornithine deacetylase/succinyl-diaminopimelate desuccinylase-like protein